MEIKRGVVKGFDSGSYRAPFNHFAHFTHLLDASFTEVVTPNNDTMYSFFWLNLRDAPVVISVPDMPDKRYFHFQLVDMYTHNYDYIGTRTTGTEEGHYLIAGPGWDGPVPEGITKVMRSEGAFVFSPGRTQVNGQADVPAVIARQKEYQIRPLNEFLGQPAPEPTPALDFPPYDESKATSAGFIEYFSFLLGQMAPPPESETALFEKFARIGIGPNRPFDPAKLDPAVLQAIEEGAKAGQKAIEACSTQVGEKLNGWQLFYDAFGDRQRMEGQYLNRAVGALLGLYGNSVEEAFYPLTFVDGEGQPLSGAQHKYVLHFEKDEIPPVRAFWSMTMYKLPERLFVDNPINRYSVGDRTESLEYGEDGSLAIYIQHESPGKESNWLPAPNGPFYVVNRLYWPKPEVLDGTWAPPPVKKAD